MTDDETFFAWLDGELHADHAAEVETRVRSDPALRALADRHRAFRTSLRAAFEPVTTPAPAKLPALRPRADNQNHRLPIWASLAATLAIGLAVGTMLPGRGSPDSPVAVDAGRVVAAGALDRALETQLASAGAGEAVRIGLTFRKADGQWCRSFDGAQGAGLACRAPDKWQVEALFPSGASGGDYRMASGANPRLAAMIDDAMADDPADAASERAARDNGWR